MKSINARQLSVHTYDEKTAEKLQVDILSIYFDEFNKLNLAFEKLKEKVD